MPTERGPNPTVSRAAGRESLRPPRVRLRFEAFDQVRQRPLLRFGREKLKAVAIDETVPRRQLLEPMRGRFGSVEVDLFRCLLFK
jgi:hypothetical protein